MNHLSRRSLDLFSVHCHQRKMCCKALFAFLVLFLAQACTFCVATSNITDLHSLLAFKAAIEFDPNNVLAKNWTIDTHFCNWYGVSCSKSGQRVTALELPNMGFVGPISPHVGNLSFLTSLFLRQNHFHGQIIDDLGRLSRLTHLYLSRNNLTGKIPLSLSQCRKLQILALYDNRLTGTLPKNLTTLPSLRWLFLGSNNLSGTVPVSLSNMSSLTYLGLEFNGFHGTILDKLALLPRITNLTLGENHFTGTIPSSFFNISSLRLIDLGYNSFTGDLPKEASLQLPNVIVFSLAGNHFTGSMPSHLYNMSQLISFVIGGNNFTGNILAALPQSLQQLSAPQCNLQGEIPNEIGTLRNLTSLDLNVNRFRGTIPPIIKQMESLQRLYLYANELEGPIPRDICTLKNLGVLNLANNRFSGAIPECIGNLIGLQQLLLNSNGLSSTIPQSLWSLGELFRLDLSSNSLHGNIGPNFTTMKSLNILDLSDNQLQGNIPDFAGSFQSLTSLNLSSNFFSGSIPESFGKLTTLVELNISNNNLSSQIPKSLEALTYLSYLNLSYNKLSGEIPTGGPFVNFTPKSFIGNPELCGESVSKPCRRQGLRKSTNRLFPFIYIIPTIVVVLIVAVLFFVSIKRKRNSLNQNTENVLYEQRMISYYELSHATNGFSEANFLGSGGFGSVYKGILSDGKIVAVKRLNLTVEGAIKSFDTECNVLRTVRHRNLVKVISTCTNPELRALVLEYIPNGSLEKWLYSHNYFLSFLERLNIMLGVAVALEYLHCGQSEPVIHCDLKPSNVLLDGDLVAHVGDFGISKILAANQNETQTSTLGTFGYIAPEYGTEGRVSTKGDVYSYGVMFLETFTRKKPTDRIFSEGSSLRKWVSSLVPNKIGEIIDENLLNENGQAALSQNIILALLDLGLCCSRDSPGERPDMKEVVTKLNKIKLQLLSE